MNKEKEIVSVIIPCYKHGEFLEETLNSLHKSTNKYVPEIIIVNDGSDDKRTLEVLTRIETKGYNVVHQKKI